jgi:hypothetical protein
MRIVAPAANQAMRLQRFFTKPTIIQIQVKHATAKFFFDLDQGSVQNGGGGTGTDAICLMASNTNPVVAPNNGQPYNMRVTGELWWMSDTANADFVILDIHEVE